VTASSPYTPTAGGRPWTRRAEWAAIIGFWLVLAVLTLVRRGLAPRGGGGLATPGVVITLSEYAVWMLLTPAIFYLARRYPLERTVWPQRLLVHLGAAFLIAAVVDLVRVVIVGPLLVQAGMLTERPWNSDPLAALARLQFLDELIIYLAGLGAGFARDYFLRFRERQAAAAQLEAQLSEARLAALRMQLNPHFLFNTLHAISALVERDPQGVRRVVAKLSMLLRRVLDDEAEQEVPLRDEIQFLRDYLDIQHVRFQGRLEVDEDLSPEALDALVPTLILQPLVENAVEHGASRIEAGTGRILIRARREGDRLVLTVQDNGPGLGANGDRDVGGVGLRNTRARLDGLYGDAGTLHLLEAAEGGLRAEVTLPYHTASDLRTVARTPEAPAQS
jgi:two-component sensor histidine kinase